MDGRTVLARWLGRRRRACAQAPARVPPHSQHILGRWFATLVALEVPRGTGAAAAALLLLASVSYGVVRGNHAAEIAAGIQDLCDVAANAAGLGITEIALSGEHEVNRAEILSLAGITDSTSLLFLDAGAARTRLLANPWIADAAVLKLYPNRLRIEIRERKPFALWQDNGRVSLIAADGTVLAPSVPARYVGLPLVVGKGAAQAADSLLAMLARYPLIAREVRASVLVAERRWTLYLKNGIEVLLPEAEPEHALARLVDLDRSRKLLSRDIMNVDLRLPDRVSVRLSEAAAARRAQAVKAMDKDRSRRGGEA
jgi:cell division protein FtsQ